MTTELATVTMDGEIVEARAPLTLFGTDDPQAVVQKATAVATALADVLKQRNLVKRMGNREYVLLEGWTLLGSMLGVFAGVEWTRPIDRGWEARAVVRTMAGAMVGSAEAMCSRDENLWSDEPMGRDGRRISRRDDYALRSMAQTRALAKALRMPLGFIVELAGYAATPADEMPDEPAPQAHQTAQATPKGQIPISALRERVVRVAGEHDMPQEVMDDVVDSAFGKPFSDLTADELLRFGTDISKGMYDLPTEPAGQSTTPRDDGAGSGEPIPAQPVTLDDILEATGGELVESAAVGAPAAGGGRGADLPPAPAASNPAREAAKKAQARADALRVKS